MMNMSFDVSMLPQQQMKASPALIALNSMLVLSTHDLQQLVSRELEENPALDQQETNDLTCPNCGRVLSAGVCMACLREDSRLREADRNDMSWSEEDENDPMMAVASPITLQESLQRDLSISLPKSDLSIVTYLVGSLSSQGYLEESVESIADSLRAPLAEVERVLRKLQEVGPAGVGARDVQECLLLQIDRLEQVGISNPHIRRAIAEHWRDLGEHRYSEIARTLGISYEDVLAVRDFLRANLRPFPLGIADDSSSTTPMLLPDVQILEDHGKLTAEVVESRQFSLCVNPLYQQLAQLVASDQQSISAEERTHMQSYMSRARLFMTNMRQRRETIRRITEYLIERQENFIRHGVRSLEPLTRAEVAAALGLHESTISRAMANKYVQLPNHTLIPFSTFFQASLSIKDVIQELITNEAAPLTDDSIVDLLQQRGYSIARRTVAKYRTALGILPSHLR